MNDELNWLLFRIIGHLGIKTRSKCRLVCKRWRSCVDQNAVVDLVLTTDSARDAKAKLKNSYWYNSEEPIDDENVIYDFFYPNFTSLPIRFKRLKRLKLDNCIATWLEHADWTEKYGNSLNFLAKNCIHFEWLNYLDSLEHLEIAVVDHREAYLSCETLKVLSVFKCNNGLFLDCPNLRDLNCGIGLNNLVSYKSVNLRQLETMFGGPNLIAYKTCVKVFKTCNPNQTTPHILSFLEKLKELHVYYSPQAGILFNYQTTRGLIDYVLEQRHDIEESESRRLDIYFLKQLLDDDKKFDDYDFGTIYSSIFVFEAPSG